MAIKLYKQALNNCKENIYDKDTLKRIIQNPKYKGTYRELYICEITWQYAINKSFAIENVIYNELLQRGYDVYIGKTKAGEVDFIAIKGDIKEYYQVAYLLTNDDVIKREFGAYKVIDDNYPKFVLSLDKTNFSQNGIVHKNIIDWLLENNNR